MIITNAKQIIVNSMTIVIKLQKIFNILSDFK